MNNASGTLLRGSIHDNQFRLFAADCTQIVQCVRDMHDLYPLPSIMMGRLITAVALMSGELKAPKSEIVLRIDGEGPLRGGIVIAQKDGSLKGYAFEPQLWLEVPEDNFRVGKHIIPGTLTVIRQSGLKAPYQGRVKLSDGEIGSDLANYYLKSEQLPTALNLGVLIDKEARIRSAGGILIQALPHADREITRKIEQNLAATPNVSDLMDMGLSLEDILHKFVLRELKWQITKSSPLRFHCDCSKERFTRGLMLLGNEELKTMTDGIEPLCQYCNRSYSFSGDEIKELIGKLNSQ